jgi:hypothetical protein
MELRWVPDRVTSMDCPAFIAIGEFGESSGAGWEAAQKVRRKAQNAARK